MYIGLTVQIGHSRVRVGRDVKVLHTWRFCCILLHR